MPKLVRGNLTVSASKPGNLRPGVEDVRMWTLVILEP
jgi:hypothetical protein